MSRQWYRCSDNGAGQSLGHAFGNGAPALDVFSALLGHSHAVWSVTFSPSGQTLVSGSIDGTIRVWRVHQHKLLATMYAFTPRAGPLAGELRAIRP